jgi:23S rRNA (uracil1939-C5)-methyltransferase
LAAVWELGRGGRVPAAILESEFFANGDDTELLLELTVPAKPRGKEMAPIAELVSELRARMPAVIGVAVFWQRRDGTLERWDVPDEMRDTFGGDHLRYATSQAFYQVSAGSFFQTNRFLVDELVDLATGFSSGDYALDCYAGTGLFTLPLSQRYKQVAAVESAAFSVHDLRNNCPSNVALYPVTMDKFVAHLPQETRFDAVIVDPPRMGLGSKVATAFEGMPVPSLTYVSCDPSTFARDLKVLIEAGYRIDQAHLIDLFPQTFHIESVFHLVL